MSSMEAEAQQLVIQMNLAINEWFDYIEKEKAGKQEEIVGRSTLQIGIHDYLHIKLGKGVLKIFSWENDYDSYDIKKKHDEFDIRFDEATAREEILPLLREFLLHKLESYTESPMTNYKFRVQATFEALNGQPYTLSVLDYVYEVKRAELLRRIDDYVNNWLEKREHPTNPLDSFFLSCHLVSPALYPSLDMEYVLHVYELTMERNKKQTKRQAEHRRYFVNAFKNWVKDVFLPQYFYCTSEKWTGTVYTKKEADTIVEPPSDDQIKLVLQSAIMIIKYEPNYARSTGTKFLELLKDLGIKEAEQIMKHGSGLIASDIAKYKDKQVECICNDVFSTVTISIKEEGAEAYGKALDYICRLLGNGFSKSYQIKLRSKQKHELPVRGLGKQGTHRFFANALQYEELYPKLEQYANTAMVEFEWYEDAEEEKCCMPGTYAVFGLALADSGYDPLLLRYMELVDDEHQSVQASFLTAFVEQNDVTANNVETIVAILLKCQDSKINKQRELFETSEILKQLTVAIENLESYEKNHITDMIWGSKDKLEKRAAKEKGELQAAFKQLLQLVIE